MLHSRYQSQRRLEEAVIVQRMIDKEESKSEDYGHGLYMYYIFISACLLASINVDR
jgi:hypothetical protein